MALALLNTPHQLAQSDIQTDGGTQSRTNLNPETVEEYAAAMEAGSEFPAIVVYHDGDKYWLADGFHRLAAWKRVHPEYVPIHADVRQGTRRDAILHSVGANSAHGLRRTNADKRRAVLCLLEDNEWGAWSDREIARRCNVGADLVGALRKSHTAVSDSMQRTFIHPKTGQPATMQTANIGKPAQAPAPDNTEPAAQEETPTIVGFDAVKIARAWLSDYRNKDGITWRGLSENQVHHANSPCYLAFVAAYPEIEHPKEALASALAELRKAHGWVELKPADTQPTVKSDADRRQGIIQTAVEDCQRILSRPAYLDAIAHASRDTQQEHDLQIAGLRHLLYLSAK